jgi:hypothetical protein
MLRTVFKFRHAREETHQLGELEMREFCAEDASVDDKAHLVLCCVHNTKRADQSASVPACVRCACIR